MPSKYERVYSVTDYWDGPRQGVADFEGAPHVYRSVWRRESDDWDEDRFYLSPISTDLATLALEDWAIWQRFTHHYRDRIAPAPANVEDWGALPDDLPRHRELRRALAPLGLLDPSKCVIARAEFRHIGLPHDGPFVVPELEVAWTRSAPEDDDTLVDPRAV